MLEERKAAADELREQTALVAKSVERLAADVVEIKEALAERRGSMRVWGFIGGSAMGLAVNVGWQAVKMWLAGHHGPTP